MHPSTHRPPHQPRPHHPEIPPLLIYTAACFKPAQTAHATPATAAAAGYGIYVESHDPPLQHRVSEPLAQRHQSLRAAAVSALAVSLRLARAVSPKSVKIVTDYVGMEDLFRAKTRDPNGKDFSVWTEIDSLASEYREAGTALQVISDARQESSSMRRAKDLARQAVSNHSFCRLCRRNYGRAGKGHECHPVCFESPCRGLRLNSVNEYERHVEERHPIAVVYPDAGKYRIKRSETNHTSSDESSTDSIGSSVVPCPQCRRVFYDFGELAKHVEGECTNALDSWYGQTTISKN